MLLEGREEEPPRALVDREGTRRADKRREEPRRAGVRRVGTRAQSELQEVEEGHLERPRRLRGEARLRPCYRTLVGVRRVGSR